MKKLIAMVLVIGLVAGQVGLVSALAPRSGFDESELPAIVHENKLPKGAYDLPEEIFGVNGLNLIDLLNEAWTNFCKAHSLPKGTRLIVQIRGSASYLVDARGKVNWPLIGDVDIHFYAAMPPWVKRFFVDYFGRLLIKHNIGYTKKPSGRGGKLVWLQGKATIRECPWARSIWMVGDDDITLMGLMPSVNRLTGQGREYFFENMFDPELYSPLSCYFYLCSGEEAQPADLKDVLKGLPLSLLFRNLVLHYRALFCSAVDFFGNDDPKAYKRLMELCKFTFGEELFQQLLRLYFEGNPLSPPGGEVTETARQIMVSAIEGRVVNSEEAAWVRSCAYLQNTPNGDAIPFVKCAGGFIRSDEEIHRIIANYMVRRFGLSIPPDELLKRVLRGKFMVRQSRMEPQAGIAESL